MAGHGQGFDEGLLGTGERGGQGIELVGAEQDPFGEASRPGGAQQMELPAVIGPTAVTEGAVATTGERSGRDGRAGHPPVVDAGTHILDDAGDLVTHDGPGPAEGGGDVEIAPADPAGPYPGHHLARAGDGVVDVCRLQPTVGAGEDDGAHPQAPMTTTGGSLMPCSDRHNFR